MDDFVPENRGGLGVGIALQFAPDQTLLVTNEGVKRYNGRSGEFLGDWAQGSALPAAHGLTFGPDGNLYVSCYFTNEIKRFDGRTGQFLDTFIPAGAGGLQQPYGLTFGPDGHLYVCSYGNNLVKRYHGQSGAFLGDLITGKELRGPTHLRFRLPAARTIGNAP